MKKNLDKNEIKEIINSISLTKYEEIISILIDEIPKSSYEKVICKIKNINGMLKVDKSLKDTEIYIKNAFKKIEKGNICFGCYSYPNGSYSYYEEDYDIYYYSNKEISEILDKAFEFGKSLIYHKKYIKAIEIFEMILYSKYWCEEIENPEYANNTEVIDIFETDIENLNGSLDFDLDMVRLYVVYGLLASNKYNNCQKIYDYLKYNPLKSSFNLGIEKIKNLNIFLNEWIQFLKTKDTQKAKILLNEAIDLQKNENA